MDILFLASLAQGVPYQSVLTDAIQYPWCMVLVNLYLYQKLKSGTVVMFPRVSKASCPKRCYCWISSCESASERNTRSGTIFYSPNSICILSWLSRNESKDWFSSLCGLLVWCAQADFWLRSYCWSSYSRHLIRGFIRYSTLDDIPREWCHKLSMYQTQILKFWAGYFWAFSEEVISNILFWYRLTNCDTIFLLQFDISLAKEHLKSWIRSYE